MALSFFENKDKIDANKDFLEISLLKVWIRLVDGSIRHAIATLVFLKVAYKM
jgi:hypothetical protein